MNKKLELYVPVKPLVVTQGFGENDVPLYKEMGLLGHPGIDCAGIRGREIWAVHDGKVVFAGADGSGGYGVVIRTLEEVEYDGGVAYAKTIFWHLEPNIPVVVGQLVKIGDIIGYMGDSGAKPGAVHLHFSLKFQKPNIEQDWEWYTLNDANGYAGNCDPVPYMNGRFASEVKIQYQLIEALKKLIDIYKKMLWR